MEDFKDIIEEVKMNSDIVSVISDYIQLKPSGSNYKGLCPFHNEKTPSFHVNASKQIYKCFGCSEGGDVISFIMKLENLDFMDSVRFLAERSGIVINEHIDEETKLRLGKIKKYQEIHVDAARFFYLNLMKPNSVARSYLIKRGLDEKVIKNFGLGFAPDAWNELKDHLLARGYDIEDLHDCGLVGKSQAKGNYYDKFRNRVMYPIFDYKGHVIGFGGRVMDDSLPKYLNSPDTLIFNKRYNLYALNFARKHIANNRTIILVEGYMDVISMHQYGIKNVVATLGTALTDTQAELIKKFAEDVVLSYDSDEAGVNASLRAIDILEKYNIKVRILDLGNSKDPDDFVREHGLSKMMEAIQNAKDSTKFKIDVLYKSEQPKSREEVVYFLKKAVKILVKIKSPLELDYYTKYLSEITGIEPMVIKAELGGKKPQKPRFKKKDNFISIKKTKNVEGGEKFIEQNLIKAMMLSRKAREDIPLQIGLNDLTDENSKKAYSKLLTFVDCEKVKITEFDTEDIDHDFLVRLDSIDLSEVNLDDAKEVKKIVNQVLKSNIKNQIESLMQEQKNLEARKKTIEEETQEAKEVDLEIMKIALKIIEKNKEMRSL